MLLALPLPGLNRRVCRNRSSPPATARTHRTVPPTQETHSEGDASLLCK